MNCWLYHNIKGTFNRVYTGRGIERLRLPQHTILCRRDHAGRRHAIQLFALRPALVLLMPGIAKARRKRVQGKGCFFVHRFLS